MTFHITVLRNSTPFPIAWLYRCISLSMDLVYIIYIKCVTYKYMYFKSAFDTEKNHFWGVTD